MVRAVPEDCGREAGARLVLVWWSPGGYLVVIVRSSCVGRVPCVLRPVR